MRFMLAKLLIRTGVALLSPEVRKLVRGVLMYHVPGGLTEDEKAEVRTAVHARETK